MSTFVAALLTCKREAIARREHEILKLQAEIQELSCNESCIWKVSLIRRAHDYAGLNFLVRNVTVRTELKLLDSAIEQLIQPGEVVNAVFPDVDRAESVGRSADVSGVGGEGVVRDGPDAGGVPGEAVARPIDT